MWTFGYGWAAWFGWKFVPFEFCLIQNSSANTSSSELQVLMSIFIPSLTNCSTFHRAFHPKLLSTAFQTTLIAHRRSLFAFLVWLGVSVFRQCPDAWGVTRNFTPLTPCWLRTSQPNFVAINRNHCQNNCLTSHIHLFATSRLSGFISFSVRSDCRSTFF